MQNYAYGNTRLNFPYGNISRMHTVSDWKIPICIRGRANPRMHTGISVHAIPVLCIRGSPWSPFAYRDQDQSPYAYEDYMSCNPRMHTGIFMQSSYAYGDLRDPHMHTGIDLDPRMHTGIVCHVIPECIWGFAWSLYAYWDHGDPSMHTGIAYQSLYAYRDHECKVNKHQMGSHIAKREWGAISRNAQVISKWGAQRYPRTQMGSDMISPNANGEWCKQYDVLLMQWLVLILAGALFYATVPFGFFRFFLLSKITLS